MPITKQTIAIIGTGGNMGSAIAKSIAGDNYRILLFDKDPEQLSLLTKEIQQAHPSADFEPMDCAYDCSWEADIIILAVPHNQEKEIADKIRDVATQKIVISITNLIDKDFNKSISDPGTDTAGKLQQWLPHSKVVKAFNTIAGRQAGIFITGKDEEALQIVTELVETAGFKPILAGNLSFSSIL